MTLEQRCRYYEQIFWLLSHDMIFVSLKKISPFIKYADNSCELQSCYGHDWLSFWINCNDTFYIGTADCEEFGLEETDMLTSLYKNFGIDGLIAAAAVKRGMEPLEHLRTPRYEQALKVLNSEAER